MNINHLIAYVEIAVVVFVILYILSSIIAESINPVDVFPAMLVVAAFFIVLAADAFAIYVCYRLMADAVARLAYMG